MRLIGQIKFSQVIEEAQRTFDEATVEADSDSAVVALIALSDVYVMTGETEQATTYAQKALKIARENGEKSCLSLALSQVAAIAGLDARYEDELATSHEALVVAEEANFDYGRVVALTVLGTAYGHQFKLKPALSYLEQAFNLAVKVWDQRVIARALNAIGVTFLLHGDPYKAAKFYERALVQVRDVGDRTAEISILCNLGHVYTSRMGFRTYDKGVEYCSQALQISQETRYAYGSMGALLALGDAYSHANRNNDAIERFEQALAIGVESRNKRLYGMALSGLAHIYYKMKIYDKALTLYQEMADLNKGTKEGYLEVNIQIAIGDIHYHLKQFDLALEKYQEASEICKARGLSTRKMRFQIPITYILTVPQIVLQRLKGKSTPI